MQPAAPHLVTVRRRAAVLGASRASSDRRSLMLDYDGTLAPFRERRMDAVPA